MSTWEKHTMTQASLIEKQRAQLRDQRVELAMSRQQVRARQRRIAKLHHRLERAAEVVDARDITLAGVRNELVEQHKLENGLRAMIGRMDKTINQWMWLTVFAMLLVVTFVFGSMVLQ